MKILGIDPGVAIVGYGIISEEKGKLHLIDCGCIITKPVLPHSDRLAKIGFDLNEIIEKFKPDMMAIEKLFFCKNVKTALKVGEARGVIISVAVRHSLPIREFTPLEVKQAVTSYGRADKNQVQQMVKIILGLKNAIKSDDAADAVAVAVTCANNKQKL